MTNPIDWAHQVVQMTEEILDQQGEDGLFIVETKHDEDFTVEAQWVYWRMKDEVKPKLELLIYGTKAVFTNQPTQSMNMEDGSGFAPILFYGIGQMLGLTKALGLRDLIAQGWSDAIDSALKERGLPLNPPGLFD